MKKCCISNTPDFLESAIKPYLGAGRYGRLNGGFIMGDGSGREKEEGKKWYRKVPHVFVLLMIMIVLCTILTYVVPAG